MEVLDDISITVSPKNPKSNWVALDEKNNIIAEGETPEEVIKAAQKLIEDYTLQFVPKTGNTYIF